MKKYRQFILEKFELGMDLKRFLSKIHLFEVQNGIYLLKIKDIWIRAMLFMRIQEYYESPSDKFVRKAFEIEDYINWYKKDFKKSDIFTYGDDWSGFNIPSYIIDDCFKTIKNPTDYDKMFFSIVDTIHTKCIDKYYLIGASIDSDSVLDHEICHALYYLNSEYKQKMNQMIDQIPEKSRKLIRDILLNMGYNEMVLKDEIQAYLCTNDREYNLEHFAEVPNMIEICNQFATELKNWIQSNIQYPIKIDYSKYFKI